MTEQAINSTIAVACGWNKNPCVVGGFYPPNLNPHANIAQGFQIPDYCNDLNAMNYAELYLSLHCQEWFAEEGSDATVEEAYILNLRQVLAQNSFDDWMMIGATASQRAEAFLRTVGKWVES